LAKEFPNGFGGLDETKERESEHATRLISAVVDEFSGKESFPFGEFVHLTTLTGRIYGPRAAYILDRMRCLVPEDYAELVSYTWSIAEFPGLSLSKRHWLGLWRKAGFTMDGKPAERPTEPMLLWRAAHPTYKRGFAWTDSRKVAEWFLQARYGRNHRLYEVVAPPDRLLAYIHDSGRGESEWIIDARALPLIEVARKEV
jgi:hypothetical protein